MAARARARSKKKVQKRAEIFEIGVRKLSALSPVVLHVWVEERGSGAV